MKNLGRSFILSLSLLAAASPGLAQTAKPAAKAMATSVSAPASAGGAKPSTSQTVNRFQAAKAKKQLVKKSETTYESPFSGSVSLTKINSLYDRKDGTFYDGINYAISLGYKASFGQFVGVLSYDQNVRANYEDQSDFNDAYGVYAHNPAQLGNFETLKLSLAPSATVLFPVSKKSNKFDQMQTALIAGVNLTLAPKVSSTSGSLSATLGLNIGKNFHRYEEDVNGAVLSQYSSNQSLTLGYGLESFSASISYVHKTRISYQNSTREGFELTQTIAYAFTQAFSLTLGHTNAGAALKANGQDSNFAVVNEDNSVVFLTGSYGF